MPKFTKIPVTIEAWQFKGGDPQETIEAMPSQFYAGDNTVKVSVDHISIETLEGTMRADINDWIIKGVKGELYPCKPDIFEATYMPAGRNIVAMGEMLEEIGKGPQEEWRHNSAPLMSLAELEGQAEGLVRPQAEIGPAELNPNVRYARFELAVREQINCTSMENASNTPDFILAEMLTNCLKAYDIAVQRRDKWYGHKMTQLEHELASTKAQVKSAEELFFEGEQWTPEQIGEMKRRNSELQAQLEAEGEHTAAANANIDRLNTELERVTRRQQGILAGKDL